MQAAQIGSMGTISAAAVPSKASCSTPFPTLPELFCLKLHRDLFAADAKLPKPYPLTAKVLSGITQPGARAANPSANLVTAGSSSTEDFDRLNQPTANSTVKSSVTPTIAAGQRGWVDSSPIVEGSAYAGTIPSTKVEIATLSSTGARAAAVLPTKSEGMPVPKAGSPAPRRAAEKSITANPPEVFHVQGEASGTAVVGATAAVEKDVPADPRQAKEPQKLCSANSSTVALLCPTNKPEPPSPIVEADKPNLAPLVRVEPEVVPSVSVRQASLVTAVQSKSVHAANTAVPLAGASTISPPANPAVASGSAHPNQAATPIAAAPLPAPTAPALSAVRTDLQPHAAAALDPAGLRGVHVLPSGPTQLDVGVLDGTHGWLRIRAELGTDGAVSASLTASPLAHESLSAALPEMAKYLGSEAVSVTKLVVHSFSESPDKMALGTEANQQNGSAHERHSQGGNALEGAETQKHESTSTDQHEPSTTITASSPVPPAFRAAGASTDQPMAGLIQAPQSQWSLGGLEGISGNWLNVCA